MALFSKILNRFRGGSLTSADWDEFESNLIEADLGGRLTQEIISLAKSARPDDIEAELTQLLSAKLSTADRRISLTTGRTTSILVVGVNGTGKTTSVAKMMKYFKDQKLAVVVAAADTFRAAAIDQIQTWGERIGVPVALAEQADIFIVDTAGRLHTKSGLMDELAKIRRVVEKASPIDEVLLVVDATTGQNGIAQAKLFTESVQVTGLILTKMDGSAKGGIALAIEDETGIPVKFIGLGESAADLRLFDAQSYIQGLLL